MGLRQIALYRQAHNSRAGVENQAMTFISRKDRDAFHRTTNELVFAVYRDAIKDDTFASQLTALLKDLDDEKLATLRDVCVRTFSNERLRRQAFPDSPIRGLTTPDTAGDQS